jgi:hypothetical protein
MKKPISVNYKNQYEGAGNRNRQAEKAWGANPKQARGN